MNDELIYAGILTDEKYELIQRVYNINGISAAVTVHKAYIPKIEVRYESDTRRKIENQ